jgi:two-component system, OmpR family, alkaline phosphatase synthesis response regulator PhoP
MAMHRILLVEDNPDFAFGLQSNLEIEGYDLEVVGDGRVALERARASRPDLIILDLTLPGMEGYRVLHTLREEGYTMPVLILSARGEEADKVLGFRLGADDYVTKPFGLLELLARVEVMLRRHGTAKPGEGDAHLIRFGDIVIDRAAQRVERAGEQVHLTPRQLTLLLALWERRGKVVRRAELLRAAWGHRAEILSRTVDTHIVQLRRKLEADPAHPRHIHTVRKSGYRFEE